MTDATATKPKKTRSRKQTNFALGWVTETAAEQDAEGNEIPGTSRTCIVLLDLPPGLDEAGKRSRDAIERACKKAVYDEGLVEFGNKKLVVINYGDEFTVDFKKVTVVKLMPPSKADKVIAANGKDASVSTDEGDEPVPAEG
jgi:hypothetical protein